MLPRWLTTAALVFAFGLPALFAQEEQAPILRKIADRNTPLYPALARRMNLEGVVKLRVTVAPDGAAKRIEVLGGNPVFAKAAQDSVSRWKWVRGPRETTESVQLNFHPD